MSHRIDIPVGTCFDVLVDDKRIPVMVVKSADCDDCVFDDCMGPCSAVECWGENRKDQTSVSFKEIKGGAE